MKNTKNLSWINALSSNSFKVECISTTVKWQNKTKCWSHYDNVKSDNYNNTQTSLCVSVITETTITTNRSSCDVVSFFLSTKTYSVNTSSWQKKLRKLNQLWSFDKAQHDTIRLLLSSHQHCVFWRFHILHATSNDRELYRRFHKWRNRPDSITAWLVETIKKCGGR